jgi:ubiquinol-cytochrome c reductase iron-sulfur subunit
MLFRSLLPLTRALSPRYLSSTPRVAAGAHPTQQSSSFNDPANAVASPNFGDALRTESPDATRRAFSYFVVAAAGATYATAIKGGALDFIQSMNPSKDVQALANIEVNLGDVPEGSTITVKWRGKPLFIRHRSAAEIKSAQSDDSADLKHKEADALRVKDPKYLIVLGICTHLGCVPLKNQGNYGGFFCPCHGSHYDTSGRIRQGPAPLNLEVPPYKFLGDDVVLIGEN